MVGFPAYIKLNGLFGELLHQAFGTWAYHVGSSVMAKSGWRDVDVRVLLEDDDFTKRFGENWKIKDKPWGYPWQVTCMAFTALGKEVTGLPIDFQIQPISFANENHKGIRSAMTGMSRPMCGGG